MELTKGANTALPGAAVVITATASAALDIAALLVTATGKVRSDADFVFFNQPSAPGVTLQPPSTLRLDLGAVPAQIEKVVITATVDGTGTFASVQGLAATVTDAGGAPVAHFVPTGLASETALVLVEVYRRQGAWKVRAVGQGYATGLAGIATDFGISVEESPAPPPAYHPPAAAPSQPPAAPYGQPPAPYGQPPGAAPYAPPPGPPAHQQPPAAAPQQSAYQKRPEPAAGGRINLDKGRVSLQKGQSVSLVKTGAPPLVRVRMGLGWAAGSGRSIDLDASVILFNALGKDVDKVWFMSKKGAGGAVQHSGDDLVGGHGGDDEQITVDLTRIPAVVTSLVFTVNSFSGQKFSTLRAAWCRLLDDVTGDELVRFDLSGTKDSTGVVMCTLRRAGGGWEMTAIGEFHDGKTVRAMVKPAKAYV
ncbi:TerD family protein [Fodinicola feengrottensis]|uniref:TerD family protein n=1 Tax=Fodinicola feengrottensis TaxID=435914 RepID=UPI0031DBDC0C